MTDLEFWKLIADYQDTNLMPSRLQAMTLEEIASRAGVGLTRRAGESDHSFRYRLDKMILIQKVEPPKELIQEQQDKFDFWAELEQEQKTEREIERGEWTKMEGPMREK